MSSLTLLGDTSGSVILQAPAVAGSGTVTLPTTGGTIRTTTTPGTVLQNYVTLVPQGALSTYVNAYTTQPVYATTNQYTTFTITPVGVNSKFIFKFKGNVDADGGSTGSGEYICLFQGTTLLGVSYLYRRVSGSEPLSHVIYAPYTASGSNSFTISINVQSSNSYNLFFNRAASSPAFINVSCFLEVTEIAV